MTANELLQTLKARGIRLTPHGESLGYKGPGGAMTHKLLRELTRLKGAVIALLTAESMKHAERPIDQARFTMLEPPTLTEEWRRLGEWQRRSPVVSSRDGWISGEDPGPEQHRWLRF